jgi:hypothetical protein
VSNLDLAEELAKYFLNKYPVGSEVQGSAFSQGPEPVPGETTEQTRKAILRTLGVIEVTSGRGGPARTSASAIEVSTRILGVARALWAQLSQKDKLTQADVANVGPTLGDDGSGAVALLKQLGMAVGVRRAGGLRRADSAKAEASAKLREEVPPAADDFVSPSKERESTYYEFIATLLDSWETFEAAIVGGVQIGRGEWSTPDIVAVSVEPAPSLVVPIVRVATVEIKLELSRLAIAEASSHKRFAHFAYVGVPQAPVDMDPLLITELASAGLGLICPRQRGSLTFHVYLEPSLNRPDEEDLEQLLQRFRDSDDDSMSRRTRERVRKCLGLLFE